MNNNNNQESAWIKKSVSYEGETFNKLRKDIFVNAALNRSRFYNCIFKSTDFRRAAVTGSIFENCVFIGCNFDDADFEFCDFRNCEIKYKNINGCSFNNSNFISSVLFKLKMYSCTFTGAFIEDTVLNSVEISYSTLEGACFSKCCIKNINWQNLNLEFTEFIDPRMNDVTLPFRQIPYMFGILQYLLSTEDNVSISRNGIMMSVQEFIENGIPVLISDYEKNNMFFPLSNIYMFGKNRDYNKALYYISREVSDLAKVKDYRNIKFCCKLLSMCQQIGKDNLNKIYKVIADTDHSMKKNSAEMKSYSRNIGEIRSILFRNNDKPSMTIRFKTNVRIEHKMRFANLMHIFQNIAKPKSTDHLYTSFTLSQNSPLSIEVNVEGDYVWFSYILRTFLYLTGIPYKDTVNYPVVKSIRNCPDFDGILNERQLAEIREEMIQNNTTIILIDYYVKCCDEMLCDNDSDHYVSEPQYSLIG